MFSDEPSLQRRAVSCDAKRRISYGQQCHHSCYLSTFLDNEQKAAQGSKKRMKKRLSAESDFDDRDGCSRNVCSVTQPVCGQSDLDDSDEGSPVPGQWKQGV